MLFISDFSGKADPLAVFNEYRRKHGDVYTLYIGIEQLLSKHTELYKWGHLWKNISEKFWIPPEFIRCRVRSVHCFEWFWYDKRGFSDEGQWFRWPTSLVYKSVENMVTIYIYMYWFFAVHALKNFYVQSVLFFEIVITFMFLKMCGTADLVSREGKSVFGGQFTPVWQIQRKIMHGAMRLAHMNFRYNFSFKATKPTDNITVVYRINCCRWV